MNKTKIEWTDYTWNPVTGCWGPGGTAEKPRRCSYCYAEKKAQRRMLDYEREGDPFRPMFHPERFLEPAKVKKPSKIFVCSVADLFGDWVPEEWIKQIINYTCFAAPWHIFQFLTKNPKRLKDFKPWPLNCWVGTTVTTQEDADERLPWLLQVDAPVRFVSHEPLLSSINMVRWLSHVHFSGPLIGWGIIGAMTGPGAVKVKPEWVRGLIDQYRNAGVPLFLKDNLIFNEHEKPYFAWPEKIQEWPG
jgi:protein gp37